MSGLADRVLSNQELRALQGRSDLRGATRLAIHLALLTGAGTLVAVSSPGWTVLPAVLLLRVWCRWRCLRRRMRRCIETRLAS